MKLWIYYVFIYLFCVSRNRNLWWYTDCCVQCRGGEWTEKHSSHFEWTKCINDATTFTHGCVSPGLRSLRADPHILLVKLKNKCHLSSAFGSVFRCKGESRIVERLCDGYHVKKACPGLVISCFPRLDYSKIYFSSYHTLLYWSVKCISIVNLTSVCSFVIKFHSFFFETLQLVKARRGKNVKSRFLCKIKIGHIFSYRNLKKCKNRQKRSLLAIL